MTEYKIGLSPVFVKHVGFCETYFYETLYEDEEYLYVISYSGCHRDDYLYIIKPFRFITIKEALEKDYVTVEDLNEIELIDKVKKGSD